MFRVYDWKSRPQSRRRLTLGGEFMENTEKLTPDQIKNWRKIIPVAFGVPAEFLTDEDIQKFRDRVQAEADKHKDQI